MVYECKPVMCADCGGIGHNAEQCRKKRYEVAQAKIIAKKKWVPKAQQVQQGNVLKPAIQAVDAGQGLAPIAEHLKKNREKMTLRRSRLTLQNLVLLLGSRRG